MSEGTSGRGLILMLRVVGLVMVVAGAGTVLLGVASLAGAEEASAVVDSEMRFYAIWYVAAGILLWRATTDVTRQTWVIRLVSGAFFAAGLARTLSWFVVGKPHWFQVILLLIELVIPLVVIPWQAAVSRETAAGRDRVSPPTPS